jgi:hypothetical protein
MTSYAALARSAVSISERKNSGAPLRNSFPPHTPAKNVIAAPAANAANQEYASRRGDSLSPA